MSLECEASARHYAVVGTVWDTTTDICLLISKIEQVKNKQEDLRGVYVDKRQEEVVVLS